MSTCEVRDWVTRYNSNVLTKWITKVANKKLYWLLDAPLMSYCNSQFTSVREKTLDKLHFLEFKQETCTKILEYYCICNRLEFEVVLMNDETH